MATSATSQNGYGANDRSVIAAFTIPGTTQKISLRKGDTSVILLDLLGWIHANVEPLDRGVFDDWGYAERTIRGSSTTLSNHASGTAADTNATQHPLGVQGTWSEDERRRINARLAAYEGCVRWGDNYSGRVDGMHFEIDRGAADCRRVADKIRAGQVGASTAREGFLMALNDQQQADLLGMVNAIYAQMSGDEDGPGPDGWGWPSLRHDGGPELTVVDYNRHIDREVNSRLDLAGRPGPESDTIFGHVLSLRAELRALGSDVVGRLAKLAQTGGLPTVVADADPATLAAVAKAVADEQDRRARERLAAA